MAFNRRPARGRGHPRGIYRRFWREAEPKGLSQHRAGMATSAPETTSPRSEQKLPAWQEGPLHQRAQPAVGAPLCTQPAGEAPPEPAGTGRGWGSGSGVKPRGELSVGQEAAHRACGQRKALQGPQVPPWSSALDGFGRISQNFLFGTVGHSRPGENFHLATTSAREPPSSCSRGRDSARTAGAGLTARGCLPRCCFSRSGRFH